MKHYDNDPRWINARFPGRCKECGRAIKRGDRAYYYPLTKSILCAEPCGAAAERDFVSCAMGEEMYCGRTW
jgi:hypothetical protein